MYALTSYQRDESTVSWATLCDLKYILYVLTDIGKVSTDALNQHWNCQPAEQSHVKF